MPYNHLALGQAGSKTPAAQHLRDVAQFGSAPALGAGCRRFESCRPDHICGRSSMVEPQPSKLMTRVRFPSPAPERYGARRPRGAGLFACARPEANPARGAELSKCAEHLSAKPARAARSARNGCGYADSRRPLQNVAEPCPRGAGLLACARSTGCAFGAPISRLWGLGTLPSRHSALKEHPWRRDVPKTHSLGWLGVPIAHSLGGGPGPARLAPWPPSRRITMATILSALPGLGQPTALLATSRRPSASHAAPF